MGKERQSITSRMYGRYQLLKKYVYYYATAANGKGHGVHSPFVYDFIKMVLIDKTAYADYKKIEARRKALLKDHTVIEVEDLGAGSAVSKTSKRKISQIAAYSLKPKKYAQLLYRMVKYYQPGQVIELGTSLGITTSYLASATKNNVHTLEGAASVAAKAKETFEVLLLNNISIHSGSFDLTLPSLLQQPENPAFIFVDGNHRKEPTVAYFKQLLAHAHEQSIIVFDDIHWSREMEEAWEIIRGDAAVTLSIDLFFIGIVFFRSHFKVKQHFTVRF